MSRRALLQTRVRARAVTARSACFRYGNAALTRHCSVATMLFAAPPAPAATAMPHARARIARVKHATRNGTLVMDIENALHAVDSDTLKAHFAQFLTDYMTPAFGALPKREIDLRVFELLRALGALRSDASVYSLMTDLKVTRAKASQLIFDVDIRRHGGNAAVLDAAVKHALVHTKFGKDGDYFVMEIENPLTLAHMRQRIRDVGHYSDTSFNASLVRAPLDAVTAVILSLIPSEQHSAVKQALVAAGAPDTSVSGVVKSALKTLGKKVVGEAADAMVESLVETSSGLLKPLVDASVVDIKAKWETLFGASAAASAKPSAKPNTARASAAARGHTEA